MAGTRTAPAVTASATKVTVTIHLVDASGDVYADSLVFSTAPAALDIEAMVAAYQATTQASVWNVSVFTEWIGDIDPDNANTDQRNSVKQGINLLYKNLTTLKSQSSRVIAPIPADLQGNQDIPLLTSTAMAALIVAQLALLTGYSLISGQYTERKERANNPRIRA